MNQASKGLFLVEGDMTIYTAADIKAQLQTALVQSAQLAIDLSNVTDIDTAGLQLLIAAKRSCEKQQGHLKLHGAGTAITGTLQKCGLTNYFADATQKIASVH